MGEALRLTAPALGLDPDFSVLGEWEAAATFEEELRTLLYLARDPRHGLHGALQPLGAETQGLLLHLFRERSLAERYLAAPEDAAGRALLALFEAVYARYRVRLGARLLPPSEVERRALALVRHPGALERLVGRYRVVLVDEFQDVNPLQGAFFEALGLALEVVGDPKQSIYGFRHADVEVFRRALSHGEVLEPLAQTRRHSTVLTRFLNHLTRSFAAQGWGFTPPEAPEVTSVGVQAAKRGRLELHWVTGESALGELRRYEARVLAGRLAALCADYDPDGMAVLARSYAGLAVVEEALVEAGLPCVMLQGRGYFERLEIRDLYHALRVGLEPTGLSLAAWLRGPFAGLALPDVARITAAEDPCAQLRADAPEVFRRLERIREAVRTPPLDALKFLIREPFLGGARFVDALGPRARENVDALLFTVASAPPGEVGVLLERLERLSRQAEAGDVPQSGLGVKLLSVHRAKGLEWPVVALFDLGRRDPHRAGPLYVEPGSGRVALQGTPHYDALRADLKARERGESYRLLYVAASRARDVLLMSGSVKGGAAEGWAEAVAALGLGPDATPQARPDFVLQTWPVQPVPPASPPAPSETPLAPAPWTTRRFPRHAHPPVSSPSSLKRDLYEHEPLPISDPEEGERLPGRAHTVGTLVHYAISQNWRADDPAHLSNLKAQEVMFPFSEGEQGEILGEVKELLGTYWALLGSELPPLEVRDEDHPELPMALPHGATVWQGVIDRLYRVGGAWYLEDYKTDTEVLPERYAFQLAVYLKGVQRVRGVTPTVRLVYLRARQLVEVSLPVLEAAWDDA